MDDIFETAYQYRGLGLYQSIKPMQHRDELSTLVDEVKQCNPSNIMEIGTARGGTLYVWHRIFKPSTIVSIDIHNLPKRAVFFDKFEGETELHCINAHSQSTESKQAVAALVDSNSKLDFLFIDGGHKYEEVKADFESYRDLVSDDGIIALQDIVPRDNRPHYGVHEFWTELKDEYETDEIIKNGETGGIGIVYL